MMSRCSLVVMMLLGGTRLLPAGEVEFPMATWRPVAPAEVGLSQERLEAVAAALGGRGCVLKDGRLVHSWGDQSQKSDWYSSAKPVLSTLLMFAMKEGKVASPDAKIADFGWELLPKDQSMTFRHLASMTSGYARPEPPGAAWAYNDFAIQLYQKTLFDRVFKEDPDACANSPERFGALGLEDRLSFRPSNRRLSASVRDFSRLVLFWMNRGTWNGRQILPEQYFVDNMKPQVPQDLPNTVRAETNDYLKIESYGGG
jgi:CubicO group peptidase (beta-lactamase class C family)